MELVALALLGGIACVLCISCRQGSRQKQSTNSHRREKGRRRPRQREERFALAPSVEIADFAANQHTAQTHRIER